LRQRLIEFLVNSSDGPTLAFGAAIEPAQKILDRILFIAFAQRRDLMRDGLLDRALKATNEFEPQPVWRNFLGLFQRVDKGDRDMDIPPYNGGLFAMTRSSMTSSCQTRWQKTSPDSGTGIIGAKCR
jgi:hypothetical protein